MGFDLYFAGSRNKEIDDWLAANNCNRLFSQFNDRKAIAEWQALNGSGKLFIDSGAYTAYTKGATIDIDSYIEFINANADCADIFVELDVIISKSDVNMPVDELDSISQKTWDNYLYMRERVVCPDKLIPVFHWGDNIKWLSNMLETTFDGKHIPYIGLAPPFSSEVDCCKFLDTCFDVIKKSSNSSVKTHAFGVTRLSVLERYPLTSSDSTTWLMAGAMGNVLTPWGQMDCSDRKIEKTNIQFLHEPLKTTVLNYFKEHGFELEEVISSYTARMVLNCIYLKTWADNYVYKPNKFKLNKLI